MNEVSRIVSLGSGLSSASKWKNFCLCPSAPSAPLAAMPAGASILFTLSQPPLRPIPWPVISPTSAKPGLAAYAALGFLSLTWGSSFFLISLTVESIPPLSAAAMRSTLAAVMLVAVARWQGARFPATWREWRPFAALATFSCAMPFVLLGFAQQRIDSGLAAILVATTPMFTMLFGLRSAGRPPAALQWLGIALGLGGVVALVGYDSLSTLGAATLPQLVVLFVAVSYAVGIRVATRTYGYAPTVSGACTLSLASLILWPISLAVEAPWNMQPTADSWIALVLLVLLGSVAASILYYQVIRMAGATFVSLSTYLNPPVAIVAGALVLGEGLALSALAAMLMILAGVALVGRRPA